VSDLENRNQKLYSAIQDYPELIRNLISFITEPAVLRLIEAGGQAQGELSFSVIRGQVISLVPKMEMKLGYEIDR